MDTHDTSVAKKGFESLKAYEMAYAQAMFIFEISKAFPQEEKYSLTSQIRRSSRSVCANISEAYRKRRYEKHFILKLSEADGEASETIVWLHFAHDCGYMSVEKLRKSCSIYDQIGKLLNHMMENPSQFGVTQK